MTRTWFNRLWLITVLSCGVYGWWEFADSPAQLWLAMMYVLFFGSQIGFAIAAAAWAVWALIWADHRYAGWRVGRWLRGALDPARSICDAAREPGNACTRRRLVPTTNSDLH